MRRAVSSQKRSAEIRVVQYGVGPTGARIIRLAQAKKGLRIIGGIDIDPAKAGRDLGRAAGSSRAWGVSISSDAAAVLARKPEVVLHSTVSQLERAGGQILDCVHAGACVISTCEELSYPYAEHAGVAAAIDRAAKEHGVAVLGTGVNPGFVMDRLALYLSGVCREVESVNITRIVDASKRRLPLQKKVGAGMTRRDFRDGVQSGAIKHYGLPESARMVAAGIGIRLGEVKETVRPVIATRRVKTPYLTVEKGEVAGVHQVCEGKRAGRVAVRLELKMYVGAEAPVDAIEIRGDPDVRMEIPGGVHGDVATAAVVVNSIPWVLQARPGLWTSGDLAIRFFAGRAAGRSESE